MDKGIYEPGFLHCFLNALITLHLREEVTGADFEQMGFVLWWVDNGVTLSRTEPAEDLIWEMCLKAQRRLQMVTLMLI